MRAQRELTSLVSEETGKPIRRTTPKDPSGYGLGIGSFATRRGTLWAYEDETFSFRVEHVFLPKSGAVFTIAVNSGTNNDQLENLVGAVYDTLRKAGAA